MSGNNTLTSDISLEELRRLIEPNEIAYFDLSGALPTRAMQVCHIIRQVRYSDILQTLLAHSKTLRAPQGKEFPIQKVRNVIVERLAELDISTSQNG